MGKYYKYEIDTFSTMTKSSKGSKFYGFVLNENQNAFPDDGKQDGYWYVKVK